MVLGDADPVEAERVGCRGVAKPALEALVGDIRIAGVRQGAGPVSAGASVMSATQERSFHARDSTVLEKASAVSGVPLGRISMIGPFGQVRTLNRSQLHTLGPAAATGQAL